MAIKSRTKEVGEEIITEYCYVQCEPQQGKTLTIYWDTDPNRDGDAVFAKGASNEQILYAIDDSIPDDVKAEWIQVDATNEGTEEEPSYSYSVSLKADARDAEYTETLRSTRDSLLSDCEWMAVRHRDQKDAGATTSLTDAEYTALLSYRQALRDWPSSETDLYKPTAPSKPDFME